MTGVTSNPFAQQRIPIPGFKVGMIVFFAALVIAGMVAAYYVWYSGDKPAEKAKAVMASTPAPVTPGSYDSIERAPPVPASAPVQVSRTPAAAAPARQGGQHKKSLAEQALDAGFTKPKEQGGDAQQGGGAAVQQASAGGVTAASRFQSFAADGPIVPPGTPIPATLLTATSTERSGIITAQVNRDVWDSGFSCLAIPAGSTVIANYGTNVTKGQNRVEIADPIITRPWPKTDTVQLKAMSADAMGGSGLPGSVEIPWFKTGLLIAASTALELGKAYLSGGSGNGNNRFGLILGQQIDSPLEKAAKDLLDRQPVVTLSPGQDIAFVLRGAIDCEDFRR